MKRLVTRRLLWLLPLALAVAACQGPPGGTPIAVTTGLHVWLDQPPDGAVLPLGVFTLRAHARAGGSAGVETITFLVSSGGPPVTVGSVTTDPTQPLVTADFDWNPSVPAAYTIQAQAFDRAGYVFSVPARVCVGLAPAADGACAAPGAAGLKLQGLVLADLNADGDGTDAGEGPLAGVLVTLSGCDTQAVHTNLASSDPAYPEGVFAFGVAALSGCSIQVALAGYHFEAFEGSPLYPIAWPAEEAPHTILMAPAAAGTATSMPSATPTPSATATASATLTHTALASPTPTRAGARTATPSATARNSSTPTGTPAPANQPSDTPTSTDLPTATATATPKPVDTPLPSATMTTAPTATATLTQPPADTAPPTITKVSAAPNPTFYGDACAKGQAQFTASAAVSDPAGVANVTLFYRYGVNGSTGPWQSAGMAAAGGDQFSVNIANEAAAVYKILGGVDGYVEFYVQAQDALGNAGQSPSPVIAIQYCLG